MEQERKHKYLPPALEVIQMENEGVIAGSINGGATLPGVQDGGTGIAGTYRGGYSGAYGGAGSSDIEDLINDILTVEQ